MTIQTTPPILIPGLDSVLTTLVGSTSMTATGHKVGIVFHAPKSGTIDRIRFRAGTVATTPTVDVRLETVASGKPSGTLLGTNTNATSATLVTNTSTETTLTSAALVSQGDLIALVFGWQSGSSQISVASTGAGWIQEQFPSLYQDAGVGYAVIASRIPLFALRYTDGSYATGLGCYWATAAATSATYSTGEQGVRFRLPFRARVSGLWHTYDPDTALTFNLYSDATSPGGTTLATRTQQSVEFEATNASPAVCEFPSSVTLNPNTWYRLVAAVSAASSRFNYIDVGSQAELAATIAGADWYQTVSSGASWVDTVTRQPQMGLVIDGLDDGVGGAFGQLNMRGGFVN